MKKLFSKVVASAALLLSITLTTTSVSAEEEKKQYLIGFENQIEVSAFIESSEKVDGEMSILAEVNNEKVEMELLYEFDSIPVVSVELSPKELADLKADSSISFIEEDVEVSIANQTTPWGITRVQAPFAHSLGLTGLGVKVAVLDTGIATHPDLNIRGGVSFVPDEPTYQDGNGHGTHVAGTIAALNNSIGVIGVAPNAELYAVKVLGADGNGTVSSIAQGLQWSAENGMDIANLSLGSPTGSPTLELAVNQATSAGVLVVAATGNNGSGTVSYPARYANALAVGATDQNDNRASFSQYGTGLDIVAPGVGVQSTYLQNQYASLSGTSMATPHVAGVAALVKEKNPTWSNVEIRQHLTNTATPLGNPTQYGSGLVNAEEAVR